MVRCKLEDVLTAVRLLWDICRREDIAAQLCQIHYIGRSSCQPPIGTQVVRNESCPDWSSTSNVSTAYSLNQHSDNPQTSSFRHVGLRLASVRLVSFDRDIFVERGGSHRQQFAWAELAKEV